jgi:hypothetical protein
MLGHASCACSMPWSRTRGRVTAVAVGSECLLVVTSRAFLLRYDFAVGSQPGEVLPV